MPGGGGALKAVGPDGGPTKARLQGHADDAGARMISQNSAFAAILKAVNVLQTVVQKKQ